MLARLQSVDTSHFSRLIAVSDIHGADEAFARLLEQANFCDRDALFLLGDYIERGDECLPLLRRIMRLSKSENVFPLLGNCDTLLEEAFEPRFRGNLVCYMAKHTHTVLHEMLAAAGTPFSSETTEADLRAILDGPYARERQFLKKLPHIIETPDYIFVHAGLDEGPLTRQDDDRCTKRSDFIDDAPLFRRTLVVGHMPCQRLNASGSGAPLFLPERRLVFIDGGAQVFSDGALNALIIEGGRMTTTSVPVQRSLHE